MRPLMTTLSLYYGCGGVEAAFVADRGGCLLPSRRLQSFAQAGRRHLSSTRLLKSSLFSLVSNSESETSTRTSTLSRKEMALQLIEENSMPPLNTYVDNRLLASGDANQPLSCYDEDPRTPLESEFTNLMSTFLTYSEQDIQSLTSTSARYFHCGHHAQDKMQNGRPNRPRRRSKEEGIRYRVLYSGVQAASLEPQVLRSFTVLFEDYLPIRLAGRRIYGHLKNVMEEVREERRGEIATVRELCPGWDYSMDSGEDLLEYARNIWDVLTDKELLLDSTSEAEQSEEAGVISFSQMILFGIDQVLIKEGFANSVYELEGITRQIVCSEDIELEGSYNLVKEESMEMTFPIFMKVLYRCAMKENIQNEHYLNLLRNLEQKVLDLHVDSFSKQDTSTIFAANAVHSGSRNVCRKRQKYSDRFEWYISKFQLWETTFLGNDKSEINQRRMEILTGCFSGARNAKVVAALKIVYMDYAALRLAGDLIFKLMSKIAD